MARCKAASSPIPRIPFVKIAHICHTYSTDNATTSPNLKKSYRGICFIELEFQNVFYFFYFILYGQYMWVAEITFL